MEILHHLLTIYYGYPLWAQILSLYIGIACPIGFYLLYRQNLRNLSEGSQTLSLLDMIIISFYHPLHLLLIGSDFLCSQAVMLVLILANMLLELVQSFASYFKKAKKYE